MKSTWTTIYAGNPELKILGLEEKNYMSITNFKTVN